MITLRILIILLYCYYYYVECILCIINVYLFAVSFHMNLFPVIVNLHNVSNFHVMQSICQLT